MELTLGNISGRLGQSLLSIVCLLFVILSILFASNRWMALQVTQTPPPATLPSATNVSVSSVVRTITIGLSFMEPRYGHRAFPQPAAVLDISAFFLRVRKKGG